jgi:hypothetical protein
VAPEPIADSVSLMSADTPAPAGAGGAGGAAGLFCIGDGRSVCGIG